MWFHQLGGIYDAEVVSIVIQMFMAICAVMCLLAAGACGLHKGITRRSNPDRLNPLN